MPVEKALRYHVEDLLSRTACKQDRIIYFHPFKVEAQDLSMTSCECQVLKGVVTRRGTVKCIGLPIFAPGMICDI